MKHLWLRAAALGTAALLLTAAYKRAEQASVMADAANNFLATLWTDRKRILHHARNDVAAPGYRQLALGSRDD